MKPLIDADVIRMEIGSVGQYIDDEGEIVMRPWSFVEGLIDSKLHEIQELTWADEPPKLFLTCCPRTHRILHRRSDKEYTPNFRDGVATVKPYKGSRKGNKPLHYDNITAYFINCFDTVVAEGMEADDLLAIAQTEAEPLSTVICTRDKDLKTVPGYYFSWACGKQSGFGPAVISEDEASKFFCTQLLTGDTVDNIPGLPGIGPVKAAEILEGRSGYLDCLEAVTEAYRGHYEDSWEERILEQGRLLWMARSLDNGIPVMWNIPEELIYDNSRQSKDDCERGA